MRCYQRGCCMSCILECLKVIFDPLALALQPFLARRANQHCLLCNCKPLNTTPTLSQCTCHRVHTSISVAIARSACGLLVAAGLVVLARAWSFALQSLIHWQQPSLVAYLLTTISRRPIVTTALAARGVLELCTILRVWLSIFGFTTTAFATLAFGQRFVVGVGRRGACSRRAVGFLQGRRGFEQS
jgi:hypothetical protein